MKLIISRESVTDSVRYCTLNSGDTIEYYNPGDKDKPFMLIVYTKKLFRKPAVRIIFNPFQYDNPNRLGKEE